MRQVVPIKLDVACEFSYKLKRQFRLSKKKMTEEISWKKQQSYFQHSTVTVWVMNIFSVVSLIPWKQEFCQKHNCHSVVKWKSRNFRQSVVRFASVFSLCRFNKNRSVNRQIKTFNLFQVIFSSDIQKWVITWLAVSLKFRQMIWSIWIFLSRFLNVKLAIIGHELVINESSIHVTKNENKSAKQFKSIVNYRMFVIDSFSFFRINQNKFFFIVVSEK